MDVNQAYFISILSDHLSGRKTCPVDGINWDIIKHLSGSHQVDGIVAFQCKSFMPPDAAHYYEQAISATLFCYANRLEALRKVSTLFHARGIPFITVKGFSVAEHYPIPALRTMGDCDIIVCKKDMAAAMRIMKDLGYRGIDNDLADSWECAKDGFLFEVHDQLVGGSEHATVGQRKFFNQYDSYIRGEVLEENFSFLFLLMHLRKHFMNSGVGIRLFLDMAAMIQSSNAALDWNWIETKLQELELMQFAGTCFYLIDKWFGITTPVKSNKLNDVFYEQVTVRILRNGVFGGDDPGNRGNYERNLLIKATGTLTTRRLVLIGRSIIPSYGYMRSYPGCGFVDGRPYLLPVAWLCRFVSYARRKKGTTILRVLRGAFTDKKQLDIQKSFLEQMGL